MKIKVWLIVAFIFLVTPSLSSAGEGLVVRGFGPVWSMGDWDVYYSYYPLYYPYFFYGENPKKSPYPEEIKGAGVLTIKVPSPDTAVFVDGRPIEVRDLIAEITLLDGRHRVEVRREGYKPYAAEIEIKTGLNLLVTLEKE